MSFSASAVPLRWPSGPLEMARAKDLTAQRRQTLERWHDPAALELLDGAPVDCIVLSWAAGLPEDTAQQRTAAPLVEAARWRGISVVGWVEPGADPRAALQSAQSAGLAAVALENFRGHADLPVISYGARSAAPWDSGSPVLAVTGNVWPGVARPAGSADASAGPTSLPWLDSNGWYIQLARARTRTPLWLAFDPPASPAVVPAQSYPLAVCDAEAAGARWIISLDDDFRAGLAAAKPEYRKRWTQIGASAAFFRKHEEWKTYVPLGLVGVLSDFEGPHLDFAGEVLNLMGRRDLLFRPIWKSRAIDRPFDGLKVVLYADSDPPEAAWKREIAAFVQQGGLLIAGPAWTAEGKPLDADHPRFTVSAAGRGRVARARAPLEDPYLLAADAQSLLSHANDLVKLFNGASSGCAQYTRSLDGRKALLQVLSFAAARQAGRTSVWLQKKYRSAGLWTLTTPSPKPIEVVPAEDVDGWECHLAATSSETYLALELEI